MPVLALAFPGILWTRGVCPGVASATAKSPMEDSSLPSFNAMWQLCSSPS